MVLHLAVSAFSKNRTKNLWAPKEVVQGIYRTVAIAIARGNAEIVGANLRNCRLANWD